ncbi:hypothetical protein Purlil1_7858 [Purpureocillium lilacinum]|uniref:Uncharacterized protein n=1 Tax=Purpureocillium lilacinum TaxID=33203 RepID=A0ABR0BV94_PURLI|nr:hypothetical protein Purlil1_7858 [Purpureocillium lilacinum]
MMCARFARQRNPRYTGRVQQWQDRAKFLGPVAFTGRCNGVLAVQGQVRDTAPCRVLARPDLGESRSGPFKSPQGHRERQGNGYRCQAAGGPRPGLVSLRLPGKDGRLVDAWLRDAATRGRPCSHGSRWCARPDSWPFCRRLEPFVVKEASDKAWNPRAKWSPVGALGGCQGDADDLAVLLWCPAAGLDRAACQQATRWTKMAHTDNRDPLLRGQLVMSLCQVERSSAGRELVAVWRECPRHGVVQVVRGCLGCVGSEPPIWRGGFGTALQVPLAGQDAVQQVKHSSHGPPPSWRLCGGRPPPVGPLQPVFVQRCWRVSDGGITALELESLPAHYRERQVSIDDEIANPASAFPFT